MLAMERSKKILKILHKEESVQVSDLVKMFGVSDVTIRKDLKKLNNAGLITKIHGGAILKKSAIRTKEVATDSSIVKNKLAKYVCTHIKNGDTIFLGSGYACTSIAKQLPDNLNISVITHNIDAAQYLKEKCDTLILLGGEVLNYNGSLFTYSSEALEELKSYNINKAITSCSGIDLNFGISFSTEASKKILSSVLRNSQSWYLIADSSKFNNVSPYKGAEINIPKIIVTESLLSKYEKNKNIIEC